LRKELLTKKEDFKMGYYSNFKITVVRNSGKVSYEDIIAAIAKISTIPVSRLNLVNKPTTENYTFEIEINEVKWYDESKDMKKIAKSYPNFYFIVEREGENKSDESLEVYFRNKYDRKDTVIISPFEQFVCDCDVENDIRDIISACYGGI
jgi:hypothetical protein